MAASTSTAAAASPTKTGPKRGFQVLKARHEEDCCVCLVNTATILYVPCGHACLCAECSEQTGRCPLCRQWCTHKVNIAPVVSPDDCSTIVDEYDDCKSEDLACDAARAEEENAQLDLIEGLRLSFAETNTIDFDILTSIGDSVFKQDNVRLVVSALQLYAQVSDVWPAQMRRRHLYAYVVPLTKQEHAGIRRFAQRLAKNILNNDDRPPLPELSTPDDDATSNADLPSPTMSPTRPQPTLVIYNEPVSVVFEPASCRLGALEVPLIAASSLQGGLYVRGCVLFPHPSDTAAADNYLIIHNLATDTWFKSIPLSTPLRHARLVYSAFVDAVLVFRSDYPVELFKFNAASQHCERSQVGSRIPTAGDRLLVVDCDTHVIIIDEEACVFKYAPGRRTWKVIRELEQDCSQAAAAYHDGWMYVCGVGEFANSCYRLNVQNEQWHTMAYMLLPRIGHQAVYLDSHIYVVGGGCRVSGRQPDQLRSYFNGEKYCIDTNTWSPIHKLPPFKHNFTVVATEQVPSGVQLLEQPSQPASQYSQASSEPAAAAAPANKTRGHNNTRGCALM